LLNNQAMDGTKKRAFLPQNLRFLRPTSRLTQWQEHHQVKPATFLHKGLPYRGIFEPWSIDGSMKLAEYGIQVYASIDVYSRFMPWVYVCPTACTSMCCPCPIYCFRWLAWVYPHRDVETILVATAYYRLSKVAFEKGLHERRLQYT
jgi:hypothetical protein